MKMLTTHQFKIYVNKIENRITFKIKNGYYLELLTTETMKLLGSTERKMTTDKNGENVPHLEVIELVLVHCKIINNNYQRDSRIIYTFVPNKPFGSLLEISPTSNTFLKTFNSEFQEIKVSFTDQTSKPLEVEDKINLTLIDSEIVWIKCNSHCIKMRYSTEHRERRYVKGYGFLSFAKNIGRNLSNKYGQKLVDSAKKYATDALKTASKRAIQKTAEATGDLVGNKIADKITSISKTPASESQSNEVSNEIPKERYISPQERQKIIHELRLI